MGRRRRTSANIIDQDVGLIDDATIRTTLADRPLKFVLKLRKHLAEAVPDLREKLHTVKRYLGYGRRDGSDAIYVHLQKVSLRIDARVPTRWKKQVMRQGFEVRPTKGWQNAAGWLTGLRVPYDTEKLDVIVDLALEALRGQ